MAPDRPETLKLIQFLVQTMPDSLESKSKDGFTPLALAFSLRRVEAATILIDAGANQTARDNNGNNILHLLFHSAYPHDWAYSFRGLRHNAFGSPETESDAKNLQPLLDLVDKRLIPSLLTERSSRDPGSLTPVADWLREASVRNEDVPALRTILDFAAPTGNEHLEVFDGSGETPLHYVVKAEKQRWLKLILDYRPDLLYRENTVGRTPYELAEDAFMSNCARTLPGQQSHPYHYNSPHRPHILEREPETFAPRLQARRGGQLRERVARLRRFRQETARQAQTRQPARRQ